MQYSVKVLGQTGLIPESIPLPGFLISLNSTFGFNIQPHKFSIELAREEFGGQESDLPEIGELIELTVGSGFFPIKGRVTHTEYSDSMGGTTIAVEVEDRRADLDATVIFTDDSGVSVAGAAASGIVSVGARFRESFGNPSSENPIAFDGDTDYIEYQRIHEEGATYYEIYDAVTNSTAAFQSGLSPSDIFPTPNELLANIPTIGSVEDRETLLANYRWKFNGDTIRTALSTILDDLGFDWYWKMATNSIGLIDRSATFDIDPEDVPTPDDPNEIISKRFGKDSVDANNVHLLLGAYQEGFIDSTLLSPIDGLHTPSGFTFIKAWDDITVGFYDKQGNYRNYRIKEKEMQMALTSIEHWTYYLKHQELFEIPFAADDSYLAAQDPDFQSRIDPQLSSLDSSSPSPSGFRFIANRRDAEQNWIITWYERVRQYAANHFGRTYKCNEAYKLTSGKHGKYTIVEAAWANVENQLRNPAQGFIQGYKISTSYSPIAPFVQRDFKITPHVVLPDNTLYGTDGNSSPAEFIGWNEAPSGVQNIGTPAAPNNVTGLHYVPCTVFEVNEHEIVDPRDPDDAFSKFQPGTIICQLPIIATSGFVTDSQLAGLETLQEFNRVAASGLNDPLTSTMLPVPYYTLRNQVAIPVRSSKRYGVSFPSTWTSDPDGEVEIPKRVVTIDERFAPWNYSPGPNFDDGAVLGTSVEVLDRVASNFLLAKSRFAELTSFGEVQKVGFPAFSFDNFSDGNAQPVNGITGLTTTLGINGYTTTYSLKSHFDEFGFEAPLGRERKGVIDGIIHPIDFSQFEIGKPVIAVSAFPDLNGIRSVYFSVNPDESEKTLDVQITGIGYLTNDSMLVTNEGYIGRVLTSPDMGVTLVLGEVVPPGQLTNGELARCIDGYLNIGDRAKFTFGRIAGRRFCFFSGGRSLEEGFIAEVTEVYEENASGGLDPL